MSMVFERLQCDAVALSLEEEKVRVRLERLFQVAVPRLKRIIVARLGSLSVSHAADALQEVLLAFMQGEACGVLTCLNDRRIADIDDDEFDHCIENCCTYLSRIAERKCAEFHRKNNLHSQFVDRLNERAQRFETDPAVDLIQQEQVERLRQAVARLPKLFRQIVVQYFFKCRSEEEIGVALRISARTVRRRLHQIVGRLREELSLESVKEAEGNGRRGHRQ